VALLYTGDCPVDQHVHHSVNSTLLGAVFTEPSLREGFKSLASGSHRGEVAFPHWSRDVAGLIPSPALWSPTGFGSVLEGEGENEAEGESRGEGGSSAGGWVAPSRRPYLRRSGWCPGLRWLEARALPGGAGSMASRVTPIYRPNGMHTLMCAQRSITHKFTNYNISIIANVITSRYLNT
jgi:hypothetical protein